MYLFAGYSKRYRIALEVLRNGALQIDIYLLTYLLTWPTVTVMEVSDFQYVAPF